MCILPTAMENIDRRTYVKALGTLPLVGVLAGCSSGSDAEMGTLSTHVTDQPGDISDFESCVVTIAGMWIGPQGSESDDEEDADAEDGDGTDDPDEDTNTSTTDVETFQTDGDANQTDGEANQTDGEANETDEEDEAEDEDDGGREYHEFDEAQTADLVQLQDGNTQLVDERDLETGEYAYLQLDIDGVDATLADGSDATVEVPGNAPLKFNKSFEIRADTTTSFTGDFTPVKRGRSGGYLLQPVAKGIEVTYEESEEESADDTGNETGNETGE